MAEVVVTGLALAAILAAWIGLRWNVPPCNHAACLVAYKELQRVHGVEREREQEIEVRRLHDTAHQVYNQPGCPHCSQEQPK